MSLKRNSIDLQRWTHVLSWSDINMFSLERNLFSNHRGLEQDLGLTNWTKRSDTVRVTRATVGTTPNVPSNPRILVFWKKNHFSHFFELKKSIFGGFRGPKWFLTPMPFWTFKLMVLGVIILKNYWSELWFMELFFGKTSHKNLLKSTIARRLNPSKPSV